MNAPSSGTSASQRIPAIDLLRGLVMVLMVLDHTRDFFSNAFFNPLDLARTTPALFFTRWITHFCAPVFVLLAGISIYLYSARGQSHVQVARFLLVRGLLLVGLEFTLVHFGWFFTFDYHYLLAQVIWVIGASMIVLAPLIGLRIPAWVIGLTGVILILGHNLLDGVNAAQFGARAWVWIMLHQPDTVHFGSGREIYFLYSLIPWVGVMAVGYGMGFIFLKPPTERKQWLFNLGLSLCLAFIVLSSFNLYGEPRDWVSYPALGQRIMSFINTTKYPASLLFILMTLGPALIALSRFEQVREQSRLARVFLIFGRVPLFFYVAHLTLLHALAIGLSYFSYGEAPWLWGTGWLFKTNLPPDYGYELSGVYLIWMVVVSILYLICYWFAGYKKRSPKGWISYF